MTVFIRLASAETITVVMPLYFYANSDSKDCYRMSITAKLFSNMLKRTGADAVMILDSPTPQLEGFFDIPVDNLKVQVRRNRPSKHMREWTYSHWKSKDFFFYIDVNTFQIEPLFCHWIRKNVTSYKECVVMSPDEIGVKRVIMIADDLDVDYAVINSRRKHRQGEKNLGKRHARLNHQHLSDNWQLVEMEHDDKQNKPYGNSGDAKTKNNQGDNEDVLENVDDILRNLPSEQGLLKS